MTLSFVITLLAIVCALLILRSTIRGLPVARLARPIGRRDAALAVISAIALVGHCVAMFNAGLLRGLPGADTYLSMINTMGAGSMAWYAVPALTLLVALRGQRRFVVATLAGAFLVVGVTMYDNGRLDVHLAALFAAVVLLAATSTMLITKITPSPPAISRPSS